MNSNETQFTQNTQSDLLYFQKISEMDEKINKIYSSVESTRKYFLLTLIITVLAIIIPLIGMAFIVPYILNNIKLFGGSNSPLNNLGTFGF